MIDQKVANKFVWSAMIAAILAGFATLALIIVSQVSKNAANYGFNLWNLLDVALFWGLAFGLFKRSRTCAIILLIYNLLNRLDMWRRTHDIGIAIGGLALVFMILYFLGVLGTFAHHSIKKEAAGENKPAAS
jgi:serine/threonine-protein kinase